MRPWLSARRLGLWLGATAAALWVGFFAALLLSDGLTTPGGGRLGGDFPAFYAAGRLVLEDPAGLSSLSEQARAAAAYLPTDQTLPFPYPFPLAFLYSGLALLPFTSAYVLHTVIMFVVATVTAILLTRLVPELAPYRGLVVAATLSFLPLYRAVTGGQNTVVSLLLIVVSGLALQRGNERSSGASIGLLWFKPQFALPVTGLLGLERKWSAVATAGLGVLMWYAAGLPVWGPDWPVEWWVEVVQPTDRGNLGFNLSRTASPVELVRGTAGTLAGGVALVVATVTSVALWRRAATWAARSAVAATAVLLVAPHAVYYELALLLVPFGVIAAWKGREAVPGLALLTAGSWFAAAIPVPAGPFVVVATAWWLWRLTGPDRTGRQQAARGRCRPPG